MKKLVKFMGWELDSDDGSALMVRENGVPFVFDPLNDWNDTKKVEAKLRELDLWEEYCYALVRVACPDSTDWEYILQDALEATPKQCMEAALRVIGN